MTDSAEKPRIAIMGEFSAGKSTLCNLLIGRKLLPEKVTATRLPPIWISHGTGGHHRIDLDGSKVPITLEQLAEVDVDKTRAVRLYFDADILKQCDLIDFPGISDPNMDADVWQRVMGEADFVIWLTHATQAWRQTEQAVWETVPDGIKADSILLLTRFDKLTTERDRARVLARVRYETEGEFGATLPISLTEALAGRGDPALWSSSGAEAFMGQLAARMDSTPPEPEVVEPAKPQIIPRRVRPIPGGGSEQVSRV